MDARSPVEYVAHRPVFHALLTTAQAPQRIECTNCGSDPMVAYIGVALAVVALFVSFYSLYVTSLRRPVIEVDHVSGRGDFQITGWSGEIPREARIRLALVVANTGAVGTYVESLAVISKVAYTGKGESPFSSNLLSHGVKAEGGSDVTFPRAIERGDVVTCWLIARLPQSEGYQDVADWAARLRDVTRLAVTIKWDYLSRRRFQPWVRQHATGHRTVELHVDALRFQAVEHWRTFADYHRYADIAEGKASTPLS